MLNKDNVRPKVDEKNRRMKILEVVIFISLVLLFVVTLIILWTR